MKIEKLNENLDHIEMADKTYDVVNHTYATAVRDHKSNIERITKMMKERSKDAVQGERQPKTIKNAMLKRMHLSESIFDNTHPLGKQKVHEAKERIWTYDTEDGEEWYDMASFIEDHLSRSDITRPDEQVLNRIARISDTQGVSYKNLGRDKNDWVTARVPLGKYSEDTDEIEISDSEETQTNAKVRANKVIEAARKIAEMYNLGFDSNKNANEKFYEFKIEVPKDSIGQIYCIGDWFEENGLDLDMALTPAYQKRLAKREQLFANPDKNEEFLGKAKTESLKEELTDEEKTVYSELKKLESLSGTYIEIKDWKSTYLRKVVVNEDGISIYFGNDMRGHAIEEWVADLLEVKGFNVKGRVRYYDESDPYSRGHSYVAEVELSDLSLKGSNSSGELKEYGIYTDSGYGLDLEMVVKAHSEDEAYTKARNAGYGKSVRVELLNESLKPLKESPMVDLSDEEYADLMKRRKSADGVVWGKAPVKFYTSGSLSLFTPTIHAYEQLLKIYRSTRSPQEFCEELNKLNGITKDDKKIKLVSSEILHNGYKVYQFEMPVGDWTKELEVYLNLNGGEYYGESLTEDLKYGQTKYEELVGKIREYWDAPAIDNLCDLMKDIDEQAAYDLIYKCAEFLEEHADEAIEDSQKHPIEKPKAKDSTFISAKDKQPKKDLLTENVGFDAILPLVKEWFSFLGDEDCENIAQDFAIGLDKGKDCFEILNKLSKTYDFEVSEFEGICPEIEKLTGLNESVVMNEEAKIISDLWSFEPWSGAEETLDKIKDAHFMDELDSLLEDMYPEGITETALNDLLRFDGEWVLEALGISTSEEDEEDDED